MTVPRDERHLRLVANIDAPGEPGEGGGSPLPPCVSCGQPASIRSVVDDALLCAGCFRQSHWHPSWSSEYEQDGSDPRDFASGDASAHGGLADHAPDGGDSWAPVEP